MSQVESDETTFVDPDAPELIDYQPVNWLAILAAGLSVVSLLSFVSPVFFVLPAVAAILSVIALRSRDDVPPPGRKTALAALALALFILAAAVTRYTVQQQFIGRHARRHADAWLEAVRTGQLEAAHQLTLRYTDRADPRTRLETVYGVGVVESSSAPRRALPGPATPSVRAQQKKEYFQQHPLNLLVRHGDQATLHFDRQGPMEVRKSEGSTLVDLRYTFSYQDARGTHHLPLRIVMERTISRKSGKGHWRVHSVSDPTDMGL